MSDAHRLPDTPETNDPMSRAAPESTPSPVEGPGFVLAPRHRLFAIFDEPHQAMEAITQLAAEALASADVWVYAGEQGAAAIEPAIAKHGPGVALVRLAQRLFTNDCEYCELLTKAMLNDAMVIAVEVDPPAVDAVRVALTTLGGHSFAYGEHWNFVSVDDAAHSSHDTGEVTPRSAPYAGDGAVGDDTLGQ